MLNSIIYSAILIYYFMIGFFLTGSSRVIHEKIDDRKLCESIKYCFMKVVSSQKTKDQLSKHYRESRLSAAEFYEWF